MKKENGQRGLENTDAFNYFLYFIKCVLSLTHSQSYSRKTKRRKYKKSDLETKGNLKIQQMSEFKAELNAERNQSKQVLQTCFKDASSHQYMVFQHARTRFR